MAGQLQRATNAGLHATGDLLSIYGQQRLLYCSRLLVMKKKATYNERPVQTVRDPSSRAFEIYRYLHVRVPTKDENLQSIYCGND